MRALDERSVSDVLAFVIVFSIIITSVGLVYSVGFSSLDQFQEGEQKSNAVRAFDALSVGFDDIERDRSPARSGAIQLNGGTIQVADGTEFDVSVESGGSTIWSGRNTTNSLRYSLDGTFVGYESGAVFRKDRGASAMVSEPSFVCTDDRAIVSLVSLEGASNPRGGDNNVEIITRSQSNELLYSYPSASGGTAPDSVNLSIANTEYDDAWGRYLESNGWDDVSGGYGCTADVIVVRITTITVEFQ